jgi:hypothetical protein
MGAAVAAATRSKNKGATVFMIKECVDEKNVWTNECVGEKVARESSRKTGKKPQARRFAERMIS